MVAGYSPFADPENGDQMVICKQIIEGVVVFPAWVKDKELIDLVRKLLVLETTKRLGSLHGGANDVRSHPFFRDVDWGKLRARKLTAPWVPKLAGGLDARHFDAYDENESVEEYVQNGEPWDAAV